MPPFTADQVKVLRQAYNRGMKIAPRSEHPKTEAGRRSLEIIIDVADELEVEIKRVKAWIGNERRRRNEETRRRPVTPPQVPPRRTAYCAFMQQYKKQLCRENPHMTLGRLSTVCGLKWRSLSEHEKEAFGPQNPAGQNSKIRSAFQKLHVMLDQMEKKFNFHCVLHGRIGENLYMYKSEKWTQGTNNPMVLDAIVAHLLDVSGTPGPIPETSNPIPETPDPIPETSDPTQETPEPYPKDV